MHRSGLICFALWMLCSCGGDPASNPAGSAASGDGGETAGAAAGAGGSGGDSEGGGDGGGSGDSGGTGAEAAGTSGGAGSEASGEGPANGGTGATGGSGGMGRSGGAGESASDGSESDDCAPADPWVGLGAEEICGDWVDDDCDGEDGMCPTTAPTVTVPAWDCQGMPPAEVLAWAPLAGGPLNACSIFFAAETGELYYAPLNINMMCPAFFQERLYAWTSVEGQCDDLLLVSYFEFDKPNDTDLRAVYGSDFNYDQQPLSNECRKMLMFLADGQLFSFAASDETVLRERLSLFPTVEIGCHAWTGTQEFETVELSKTPVMFNEMFVAP